VQEARHAALALGRATRVKLLPQTPGGRAITEAWDPTSGTWLPQAGLVVPSSLQLCAPDALAQLGPVSPSCPLAQITYVCFSSNGRVNLTTSSTGCATTSQSIGTGATLYVRSTNGDKKYRFVILGLTGMVKLIDQW
jgi:hypothetical protein